MLSSQGLTDNTRRCACGSVVTMQVPLEDDQIFLHIGELQYVAARRQGKSAAQAYYLPSKVWCRYWQQQPRPCLDSASVSLHSCQQQAHMWGGALSPTLRVCVCVCGRVCGCLCRTPCRLTRTSRLSGAGWPALVVGGRLVMSRSPTTWNRSVHGSQGSSCLTGACVCVRKGGG